ncbi:MAG: CehA/McbA family metallohydrolase [Planctomyces sp.]|jgi:hypothetical protein
MMITIESALSFTTSRVFASSAVIAMALMIPATLVAEAAVSADQPSVTVQMALTETDEAGGTVVVPGMIRCRDARGEIISIPELLNRGTGIALQGDDQRREIQEWSVLPGATIVSLPREPITIEAFSGLDTELTTVRKDLTAETESIQIALKPFGRTELKGWQAANTHLHIMKLSREECDRYLTEIPAADRLDALFVSHLERAVADATYITNRYTTDDLSALTKKTGVVFGWGEEHRHNMSSHSEGFGHVMLLNIPKLIQPVSIGQGIMKQGTDGIPLQRGIRTARKDGGSIVWCHNGWGRESLPNLVTKQVDAMNIFDGGTRSSYDDSFYRYLNTGLRVPFSTGTDWSLYDFSRVYVQMNDELTIGNWLKNLSAGRSFITNGPLLSFAVNDQTIGETVRLSGDNRKIRVQASASARRKFDRLEVILDGEVIRSVSCEASGSHWIARIDETIPVSRSGWIAVRTPSPSVPDHPVHQTPTALNEYGREMFSHTSPIYVEIDAKRHFDAEAASGLLREMMRNRDLIESECQFADAHERAHVLEVHDDGISELSRQISTYRGTKE